jgi:hypothetical protein
LGLDNLKNGDYYPNLGSIYTVGIELGYKLIRKYYPDSNYLSLWANPRGIIGRYLDDAGSPLYRLNSLLCCFDKYGNLWNQPYYANLADTKGVDFAAKQ